MISDSQPEFADFYLPFGGKLDPGNRWVKLAALVPWEAVEERYAASLSDTGTGAPPLSGRIALGALIIKERLGVTDGETVEQIQENQYLQHFLGYRKMLRSAPFDPVVKILSRTYKRWYFSTGRTASCSDLSRPAPPHIRFIAATSTHHRKRTHTREPHRT